MPPVYKDVFNPETGLTETVEMEGDELAAFEALRAIPDTPPGPTKQEILLLMLDGMDPSDPDTTVLWLVLQEALRP